VDFDHVKTVAVEAEAAIGGGRPSVARVYDYLLGGTHNLPVDREVAAELLRVAPFVRDSAQANRAFLGRAVRFLVDVGIRQFLDIGAGLPTQRNVHEIARAADPASRVVYVDNDPDALAGGRALLGAAPAGVRANVTMIDGDLRDPEAIVAHPDTRRLIDFAQPVAVLLVAILHFVTDDERPEDAVAALRTAIVPGSFLVIAHGSAEELPDSAADTAGNAYRGSSLVPRPPDRIERFFGDFPLISPGLVPDRDWRPDPDVGAGPLGYSYVGVARKPVTPRTDYATDHAVPDR
jgi:hypothetical protein